MESRKNWTDKMLMAALVIGVAGAAARANKPQKTATNKPSVKKTVERKSPRLEELMLAFERSVKDELKTLPAPKQSKSSLASLPPRVRPLQP